MKHKKISSMLLVLVLALLLIPGASAWGSYLNSFETTYPAAVGSRIDTCGVCHINPSGGGARNVYGSDFAANGYSFAAIESKDSDGDGFINKDEINALTFPGDINDHPSIPPVLTTVMISPLTPTVQIPDTLQFMATALDQNKAAIGATLTWSSSDTTNGTINSTTGLFKAVAPGTTTITVTAVNGSITVTNSTKVTVTEPNQNSEVKSIKVSPPKAKIVVGKSRTFIATAFDQFKQAISAIFTWSSSNTTVGTIDNTGKFTALSAGTTTITATNGTVKGSAYVKVKAPSSEKKHEENEEEEHEIEEEIEDD